MLARTIGKPYSLPTTVTYRPEESDSMFDVTNQMFLLIGFATALALEPKLEWYACPIHPPLSLYWSVVRRWVS